MSAEGTLQVLAAEERRCTALAELDIDVLDSLFPDDLVHIHDTGHSITQPVSPSRAKILQARRFKG